MTAIRPQPGPQMAFLSSPADIAIYGGAAGGGKTWALLMEPLRHVANPHFGAVFFRRTTVQVRNEGGLWDESGKLYPLAGAQPRVQALEWRFPSGASVSFAHLEHDKTVYNWQGSQIPLICFDELTHFSERQFWYMVSRNRSLCGVRPYIRATCNPDADSWAANLIAWWLDPETGLPIEARAGVLRWFVRLGDALIWADSPAELAAHVDPASGAPIPPKSLTFIPARLTDNAALMAADPGYLANLMAQPTVERERLLGGNWRIRPAAGLYFQRGWCRIVDAAPASLRIVRGWDLAATPKTERNDPDWTAGTKIGRCRQTGRYTVLHHVRARDTPARIEALIRNIATHDGPEVEISLPQDPGQAGKAQAQALVAALAGYDARATPETGDKLVRFGPFSAQAQAGNVDVLRGAWNDDWFNALESFPDAPHDDDPDATSRAFNAFLGGANSQGLLDLMRRDDGARGAAVPLAPAPTAPGSVEYGR
ncbi:phage terminase large subunit [Caulobacter sp. S45]|uniref:phage terminase large subunit n=1 Tax=Caulobacter sp. S45 TaxID=1641861 RepID=UPI00131A8C32|nr:phage terminase large subunit [Caulobacter sp. S45]